MPPFDIIEIMKNPLAESGRPGPFLRLVLAEAAGYGLPPQIVATLDDIGAMLGFFDPLPRGQASHLAGPLSVWRTHRMQPTIERVPEIEALAMRQRALIAFGGAPPGHHVGTAEICVAMGNLYRDKDLGSADVPPEYHDVFVWASTDVLTKLQEKTPEEIVKAREGWRLISDDEVLKPGGRLHSTYTEIATSIRRTAIAALTGAPDNPREYLKPIASHFLRAHTAVLDEIQKTPGSELKGYTGDLEAAIRTIRSMFPGLDIEVVENKVEKGEPA